MGNFPWKVLENDFMVLKNIGTRMSNLLVCYLHIWIEKSSPIQSFCHQISITTDPVSRVIHSANYQINLFHMKFFVAVHIIEI